MHQPYTQKNSANLIAISGTTRSGKAMLMNIISSFQKVEKGNVQIMMEQVYYLHQIKAISNQSAIYLMRKAISLLTSNLALGREINFRKSDYTSIHNYKSPKKYMDRSKKKEGDYILNNFAKKMNIPIMMHHSSLNYKIILEAFPNIKFLEIVKNPIEIIYSWIKKGYGGQFTKNRRVHILTIKNNKNILPYFAFGWENKFLHLSNYDRIVEILLLVEPQIDYIHSLHRCFEQTGRHRQL